MNHDSVSPRQAHSAGGLVSDKLMKWRASNARVQKWMDDPNHPLWAEMERQLAPSNNLLREMIKKGNFYQVCPQINGENFSASEFTVGNAPRFFDFKPGESTGAMIRRMAFEDYVPGKLGDGFALAANNLEDQWREKNVVMLGSSIEIGGTRVCPSMQYIGYWFCGGGRYMNLHPFHWKSWGPSDSALGIPFRLK
jgi:hypothetical protein